MKIVHITPAVFREGSRGGGERYVEEYVRALRLLNLDVELLSVPDLVHFRRLGASDATGSAISLAEYVRLLRSADIVHVHHLNTPGFDTAAMATIGSKAKLILSDLGGGWWLNPGRILGRQRLRFIDGFAAISKWSADDIDPKSSIPHLAIVYGGGDHILRAPHISRSYSPIDFLFVGRVMPHKGIHVLIEALPSHSSLVVAGERRDETYFAHLKELSRDKSVTFIDGPEDDVLLALYKSARFLVLPSVFSYGDVRYARPELLGLVALEAMAVGTRAIGSDVAGLGEVLRLCGQRAIEPGNVDAWKTGLADALAEDLGGFTGGVMSWSTSAEITLQLYEECLRD